MDTADPSSRCDCPYIPPPSRSLSASGEGTEGGRLVGFGSGSCRCSLRNVATCRASFLSVKGFDRIVERNSGTPRQPQIGRDLDGCDLPCTASINQQWGSAHAICSRAV